jgi:hypothetical protein
MDPPINLLENIFLSEKIFFNSEGPIQYICLRG